MIERLAGWSISAAARKATGFNAALTYGGLVGLRVCAEREIELAAFTPQAGWRASVALEQDGLRFTAPVLNAKGAPLTLRHEEQVTQLETLLKQGQFWVDKIRTGDEDPPCTGRAHTAQAHRNGRTRPPSGPGTGAVARRNAL